MMKFGEEEVHYLLGEQWPDILVLPQNHHNRDGLSDGRRRLPLHYSSIVNNGGEAREMMSREDSREI